MIDTEYEMLNGLSAALSAEQDRRQLKTYESILYQQSPSFEIRTNVLDPSGGALYSGGSSYTPGMPFMASSSGLAGFQAPLCQRDILGSLGNFQVNLAGFDDALNKDVRIDSIKNITLATIAGGTAASTAAKKLLAQSSEWASIASSRAQVEKAARSSYSRIKAQVEELDRKTAALLSAKKTAEAEKVRKEAVAKALLATQYQKVNALVTQLAETAMGQSLALKQMAALVSAGKYPDLDSVNVLYMQYNDVTKKARDIRKKQFSNIKIGLEGVRKPVFVDYFEEELQGLKSLKRKAKKQSFVFGNYTIEPVGGSINKANVFRPVKDALAGAAKGIASAVKQVVKKTTAIAKKPATTRLPPKRVVVPAPKAPIKLNVGQVARQGTGAATAALIQGNIKGITPEQLTKLTQQAQSLAAGSASSASSIIAQARQV